MPLRAVWHENILYVVAEEEPKRRVSEPMDSVFEELGRYSALFLSIEQQLTGTRLQYMRRLYCPSEFSFAAACCYALTYSKDKAWECRVFGPCGDPTTPRSVLESIVSASSSLHAVSSLVSEEQRLRSAQLLYKRVGILAPAACVAGVAIQEQRRGEQHNGVEVVIVSGTLKLEELPQVAALALSVNPF